MNGIEEERTTHAVIGMQPSLTLLIFSALIAPLPSSNSPSGTNLNLNSVSGSSAPEKLGRTFVPNSLIKVATKSELALLFGSRTSSSSRNFVMIASEPAGKPGCEEGQAISNSTRSRLRQTHE